MKNYFSIFLLLSLIFSTVLFAEEMKHQPSEKDKCPVCGMFVSPYPNWLAEVVLTDGRVYFFDGVKDLAKFYLNPGKYGVRMSRDAIKNIRVTEYYDLKMIEAKEAYYVMGSDIYGPMGRELIPFMNEEDAEIFRKDHKGRRILQFDDITHSVLEKLD